MRIHSKMGVIPLDGLNGVRLEDNIIISDGLFHEVLPLPHLRTRSIHPPQGHTSVDRVFYVRKQEVLMEVSAIQYLRAAGKPITGPSPLKSYPTRDILSTRHEIPTFSRMLTDANDKSRSDRCHSKWTGRDLNEVHVDYR